MKRVLAALASVGLALGLVGGVAAPAWAGPGSLAGPSASISWDDTTWFVPKGCSQYPVQYSVTAASLVSSVKLINQFGDILDSASLGNSYGEAGSGTALLELCDYSLKATGGDYPLTVQLTDVQSAAYGDGSTNVYTAAAILHSRTAPPTAAPAKKRVHCINKKTFEKRWFQGVTKCPRGWIKI